MRSNQEVPLAPTPPVTPRMCTPSVRHATSENQQKWWPLTTRGRPQPRVVGRYKINLSKVRCDTRIASEHDPIPVVTLTVGLF